MSKEAPAISSTPSSTTQVPGKDSVTFDFTGVESARRMQNESDRRLGIVRHCWDAPVGEIRAGLVNLSGPNPRPKPKTKKKVAQQIMRSVTNQDVPIEGVFHLAHLGITIVGEVEKVTDDHFRVTFNVDDKVDEPSDGIVNGLHTLAVFEELDASEIPDDQYVTLTVISGIPPSQRNTLIPWIAKGRNTVLQVKDHSIDELMGLFQPYKEVLEDKPYFSKIGWQESSSAPYDVLDLLSVQTALNPIVFPNEPKNAGGEITHPVVAYEKQSACLAFFENKDYQETYYAGLNILDDALDLFDTIRSEGREKYNQATGGKAGHLRIMEARYDKTGKAKPNAMEYPFKRVPDGSYPARGAYRLTPGASFAILAAFRPFVRFDKVKRKLVWDGGYEAVKEAWDLLAGPLMVACAETSQSLGGANNQNATGKHRPLWRGLHTMVRTYKAEQENRRLREQLDKAMAT